MLKSMPVNRIDPNSFRLLTKQIPPLVGETPEEYQSRLEKASSDTTSQDSPAPSPPLTAKEFHKLMQEVPWNGEEINEYIEQIKEKL